MLDKERMFKRVVYAQKYKQLNLVLDIKILKNIFNIAWILFKRYEYDEAVTPLDVEFFDISNEYNLQCTYDKLINIYLKLHPEKNFNKR